MNLHPLCSIFPAMSAPEFEALKADIAAHGLREPVWTWRGSIIDGRHRWQACMDLGIEPMTREHDGDESTLVGFVLSMNLSRRHLSESQRAAVATKLAALSRGRPSENAQICAITQQEAADKLNVSRRSVQLAREVIEKGSPELAAAVDQGEVSVSAAAVVAKTVPKEEQAALVAQKAVAKAAKQARAKMSELTRPLRIEIQRIDERLAQLAGEKTEVEARLATGELRGEEFAEIGRRLNHVMAETSMLEERWLELQGELESLQAGA